MKRYLAVATTALLLLAGCGQASAPAATSNAASSAASASSAAYAALDEPVKITVAQASDSLTFIPIYIAEAKGYFKDQKLDVERIVAGGGPKVTAAVLAGSTQFGASVFSDTLAAIRQGQPVIAIAATADKYTEQVVIRKEVAQRLNITASAPLADKLKALKGLKIAISTPGSGSDQFARFLLKQAGFNPDQDAYLVALGAVGPTIAALQQGTIDAAVSVSPAIEQAVGGGSSLLFIDPIKGEIPQLKGALWGDVRVTTAYANSNPRVVAAFVRALAQAEKLAATDKDAAREVVRPYFKSLDPQIFETSWENQYQVLPKTPVIQPEGAQRMLDFDNSFASKQVTAPLTELIDNRYAEAAATAVR